MLYNMDSWFYFHFLTRHENCTSLFNSKMNQVIQWCNSSSNLFRTFNLSEGLHLGSTTENFWTSMTLGYFQLQHDNGSQKKQTGHAVPRLLPILVLL
jgi:hypothetical protein